MRADLLVQISRHCDGWVDESVDSGNAEQGVGEALSKLEASCGWLRWRGVVNATVASWAW